jgi:hypothetical protein
MMSAELQQLQREIETLRHELATVQDVLAIRNLQHTYGYYLDKCLYDEVVDLFAADSETRFLGGVFRGQAGARRLYGGVFRNKFAEGRNGPAHGQLLEHLTLQDVIDVAADRASARGRFRCFMQGGSHRSARDQVPQFWEGGVYENLYVRDDNIWKIKILNYNPLYNCRFEKGWAHTEPGYAVPLYSVTYPQDPLGPDALTHEPPHIWPNAIVVPFHYPHPVTGRPVK